MQPSASSLTTILACIGMLILVEPCDVDPSSSNVINFGRSHPSFWKKYLNYWMIPHIANKLCEKYTYQSLKCFELLLNYAERNDERKENGLKIDFSIFKYDLLVEIMSVFSPIRANNMPNIYSDKFDYGTFFDFFLLYCLFRWFSNMSLAKLGLLEGLTHFCVGITFLFTFPSQFDSKIWIEEFFSLVSQNNFYCQNVSVGNKN